MSTRGAIAAAAALFSILAAPAAHAQSGGMEYVPVPEIAKVSCAKSCAGKRPRAGGAIRISGRNLAAVTRVIFHGGPRRADDVAVKVRPRSDRRISARVPMDARSGPISLLAGRDVSSARSKRLPVLPPPPPQASADLTPAPGPRDPGAPRLETGTSRVTYFFGAKPGVTFFYRVSDDGPVTVQVLLVRASDGVTVRSWDATVPPGETQQVEWDGLDAAGQMPPEGRYAFRLVASGAGGAQVRSAQVQDVRRDAFDYYGHIFPVRGRHDFGSGDGARFGAGRDGHSHQGQDVFARCGTRLAAARGGVVKFKQYHAAAGHYIVIDGDGTGVDYAYMHMAGPSPLEVGDRVFTGQQIGQVGDSGNASGCHLHFELWEAPGWYDGGRPFDPYPSLVAWDAVS